MDAHDLHIHTHRIITAIKYHNNIMDATYMYIGITLQPFIDFGKES